MKFIILFHGKNSIKEKAITFHCLIFFQFSTHIDILAIKVAALLIVVTKTLLFLETSGGLLSSDMVLSFTASVVELLVDPFVLVFFGHTHTLDIASHRKL